MKSIYFFNTLLIAAILGILAGCASVTPLQPGAENVVITKDPISKNCKWLGKVSISDESRSMSTPYQHTSLKADEFNILKNQARQLGANMVLLSSSSGMINKKHWHSKQYHAEKGTHVFAGDAYRCPGR